MGDLSELAQFLEPKQRQDLKSVALQYVLGQTGSAAGIKAISDVPVIYRHLIELLRDPLETLSKDASLALINLSADPSTAKTILQSNDLTHLVKCVYDLMEDCESKLAEAATMILSNLTRDLVSCRAVWDQMTTHDIKIERLVFILCQEGYNRHGASLRYLGPVLSNLSQLEAVRRALLDREQCVIQRLLPFTEYAASHVKRGGVIGTLRNCCFETSDHPWLLGPQVDLLPRLLLPLAGPTPDNFSDAEMENLPLELQYLGEEKVVEEDPDLRKMLIEALTQLCATRASREFLREKNVYLILRELHKTEKEREVGLACHNIIDILIKTEEEINLENYKDVEVPQNLLEQFKKMDQVYLED